MESQKSPLGNGSYPLQYSGLYNSMDCKNHGTAKSLTILSAYNVPFLSKKNPFFSIVSVIGIDCRHQRTGRNGERRRLNVVGGWEEELGVLDMNPGFPGKWGG